MKSIHQSSVSRKPFDLIGRFVIIKMSKFYHISWIDTTQEEMCKDTNLFGRVRPSFHPSW